jgi:hypothetical protein
MSKYREDEPIPRDIELTFEDLDTLEKLRDTKKLTEKQRIALRKLLYYWHEH